MSLSSGQPAARTPDDRIRMLSSDLEKEISSHRLRSSFWGTTTRVLRVVAVLSSAAASFLGIAGFKEYVEFIGVLAAVPVVIAFIGSNLKCYETVQWHTDFSDKLENLKRELLFELPASPSDEQVSNMSLKYRKIFEEMSVEAKKFGWSFNITSSPQSQR